MRGDAADLPVPRGEDLEEAPMADVLPFFQDAAFDDDTTQAMGEAFDRASNVSSTIRTFSDAVQRRRRCTDVMISTRSAGLVIDTVVCLTLA
jgi:hypothetical protein